MPDDKNQQNTIPQTNEPPVPPMTVVNETPPPPIVIDTQSQNPREESLNIPEPKKETVPPVVDEQESTLPVADIPKEEEKENVLDEIPPVVETNHEDEPESAPIKKRKRIIPTILGIAVLSAGVAVGILLTQQEQDIREKAWFYSTDPTIGTQCPAFGGYSEEEIGTFQGQCMINYCPEGFQEACSAGMTPGAWSETKPCSEVSSLESQNYCGQTDYLGDGGLYCNIAPPGSDQSQPGGCGAKELTQLDLNGNGIVNEAEDCNLTPTPPASSTSQLNCDLIKIYKVVGDIGEESSWVELTNDDLSKLISLGITEIYLAVSGSAKENGIDKDTIDKARFSVSSDIVSVSEIASWEESSLKKPGSIDTFYFKYTLPDGQLDFNVFAQLHDSDSGTWF